MRRVEVDAIFDIRIVGVLAEPVTRADTGEESWEVGVQVETYMARTRKDIRARVRAGLVNLRLVQDLYDTRITNVKIITPTPLGEC